jgi:hypothetical protein
VILEPGQAGSLVLLHKLLLLAVNYCLILEAEINSFESEIVSVIRLISILIVSIIESEIV